MRGKIYLSDEGYGHIIRQRAIMDELLKLEPSIQFAVQTKGHLDFAKRVLPGTEFIDQYNLVSWQKNEDSSPNLGEIKRHYETYMAKSEEAIETEPQSDQYDFFIADFVYEAFGIANKQGIPAFGIGHFTWDWFFSKLYPRVISDDLFKYFSELAGSANALFFPPLTPPDILSYYNRNAISVPWIIRNDIQHRSWPTKKKLKVLIMDSGAGLMKANIERALRNIEISDCLFGVLETVDADETFVFRIPKDNLLVDYVRGADLVIGRPGFNTLSECIAYKVPMLLISETMNPEMEHNIMELKKLRLGAFMSMEDFTLNFNKFLGRFLKMEYQNLMQSTRNNQVKTNGAEVIAREILNRL